MNKINTIIIKIIQENNQVQKFVSEIFFTHNKLMLDTPECIIKIVVKKGYN